LKHKAGQTAVHKSVESGEVQASANDTNKLKLHGSKNEVQIPIRECLLPFFSESSVFPLSI
jgi:hypothetical protein